MHTPLNLLFQIIHIYLQHQAASTHATQAALQSAAQTGEVDMEQLRSIEAAAASAKKVKVSSERLASLEKALEAALEAANACQGDDCAVEWEAVEEISAAKSKIENTD